MYDYLSRFVSDLAILGALAFALCFLVRALRELFAFPKEQALNLFKTSMRSLWPFPNRVKRQQSEEGSLCLLTVLKCLLTYTSLWAVRFIDGNMRYPDVGGVYGTSVTLLQGLLFIAVLCMAVLWLYKTCQMLFPLRDAYWIALFLLAFPLEALFGASLQTALLILLLCSFLYSFLQMRRMRQKRIPAWHIPLSNRVLETIWILLFFGNVYFLLLTRFFKLG